MFAIVALHITFTKQIGSGALIMVNGMDFGKTQAYSSMYSAPTVTMMIGLNDTNTKTMVLYSITNSPSALYPNMPYLVVEEYNAFGWRLHVKLLPNWHER